MADADLLLEGLAAGREEAFAALYDRYGSELLRVAHSLSPMDADDAVQDVFVGLMRARKSLGEVDNLRAYLFAALRRALTRLGARRKGMLSLAEPELIADELVRRVDQSVALEQALVRLPFEQRELVALKVDGGLTFAEIGQVLGISPNTAASRYRYALEKLRRALEGLEPLRVEQ
jgi:RNA polymerase sigma-70 factor (ECF subfamily)